MSFSWGFTLIGPFAGNRKSPIAGDLSETVVQDHYRKWKGGQGKSRRRGGKERGLSIYMTSFSNAGGLSFLKAQLGFGVFFFYIPRVYLFYV